MALQECGLNMNSTQKELRPHGTAEFPCAGYESEHTPSPDDVIPWHWHEEFEVIFIPEGVLRLKILSETYVVKQGELAIINSGVLHYGDTDNYCHLQSIVFSPLLITGTADSDFSEKYVRPLMECCDFSCLIFPATDPLSTEYKAAFEALKTDRFAFEFTVREVLSHIIIEAYRKYEPSIIKPDICSAAYIGEREAMRCFKRTVGESPMQYLIKFRLMKSANMLLEKPTVGIAEIAGRCGFDSPSYYTKQFKTLYKCTPRDYVKQHK